MDFGGNHERQGKGQGEEPITESLMVKVEGDENAIVEEEIKGQSDGAGSGM